MKSIDTVLPTWLHTAHTIAIVGFGREGKSTLKFLQKYVPTAQITIYDEQNDIHIKSDDATHVTTIFSPQAFSAPITADVVFKSPGISKKKIVTSGLTYLTSQSDLFLQLFGKQTIAVTGTKGKSTTSMVINSILTALGKDSILIGNIGKPVLDVIEQITNETYVVMEMSAFQSESLHVAPHIGVFTNLYQDHLDYYDSMEEYAQAKKHLFELQTETDITIYNQDDLEVASLLEDIDSITYTYSLSQNTSSTIYIQDGYIINTLDTSNEQIPTSTIPLQGKHNILNCLPGILIPSILTIGTSDDIQKAIQQLKPLKGRLELVATKHGIEFYDDALATIPEATITAINTLGSRVETLIVGGFERGQRYEELAKVIIDSHIQHLILFPPTGERIKQAVDNVRSDLHCIFVHSMNEAIEACFTYTKPGNIVLLSTAAPSFGLFDDYRDRSAQYKTCIQKHP